MKKNLFKLGALALTMLTLAACGDDADEKSNKNPLPIGSTYTYVVSAGNWNENNGSVYGLTMANEEVECLDIYRTQNGKGIGDAQDLVVTNNKLFVTSTTSSKIEVLNMSGKLLKSIPMENVSPRYIVADNNKVYFSAYDGKVYKMDASTYTIDATIDVGAYPEAMSICNGKLYVNLSNYLGDGNGKYVAVVDLASFQKTKNIEVDLNPYNQSVVLGNYVYGVSCLDYSDNVLQRINATNDTYEKIGKASSISVDPTSNTLVCLYAVYGKDEKRLYRYNPETKSEQEITNIGSLSSPSQVNVDPRNGNIFVINSSYSEPCTLYVYDKSGKNLISGLKIGYGAQNIRFAQ